MPGADRRECDQDRHTDECAGHAPQCTPEEYREQHHEGRDRNRGPCNAWFYVAADNELKKIEAAKHDDRCGYRLELGSCEKSRKQSGNERADKGYEIQDKSDHPPFAV